MTDNIYPDIQKRESTFNMLFENTNTDLDSKK